MHARLGLLRAVSLGFVIAMLAACAKPPVAKVASAPPPPPAAAPTGQLPEGVAPVAYHLSLQIVPSSERFSGRVQVMVGFSMPTKGFWMHGKNLNVVQTMVDLNGRFVPGQFRQVDQNGLARVEFNEEIPAGQHYLTLDYDAPFDQRLDGLYKVQSGADAYAFTQFEPVSARMAFPCFDEPRWKTPFDISLTVQGDHVAISNTTEAGVEAAENGLKRIRFATTQPLPTYLVAFMVGPFDVVAGDPIAPNDVRPTPLPFRAVATRGKGGLLRYALDHTPALVTELERYFGIAYPYDKLDVLAVPDFSAGAMENAGAITFRERLLLIDPKNTSEGQLRGFTNVMAHELAHHWTGNLVTMPWWDDIWLNEAFATFLATRTVTAVHPEMRADVEDLKDILQAMDVDSRQSARRIRQPIESTHDIANAFDSITYQKGAGVIAMFERALGPDVFRAGIQAHMRAHAHGVATSKQLLDALSAASNKDVATAASTFLDQVGVPLLTVEPRCNPDGSGAELHLKQSRYLPLGSSAERNQLWQIPVCARYQVGGLVDEMCTLLTGTEGTLPLDGGACPSWVMPNAGGTGYYRFAMPAADLEKLRKSGYAKLTPSEKLSLADSMRAGFESGMLEPAAVLSMLQVMAQDEDRNVANAPMELLGFARDHLLDEATRPALDRFARDLYAAKLKKLGWKERPKETGDQKMLRADILVFMARELRDEPTRKQLGQLGQKVLGLTGKPAPETVPMDLRTPAVVVAVQQGDDATFTSVYDRFKATEDPIERERLLVALASVTDARSARALALVLDPVLRVNEALLPLRLQMQDERTRGGALQYLEQNIDAIINRVSTDRAGGLPRFTMGFCSQETAARVQALFASRIAALEGGPRMLAATIEELNLCAAQVAQQKAPVSAFFAGLKK